ncbi:MULTISPECIES: response regulator transcription factor [Paenibacillus]|jgi:YesN/AraC family two-component response regulator|uniref:YesN/AraC family two-component response regulator n=2 Tax=Paenibacillus TaxID=44249 RepID=A0ABU1QHS3_9BACL|nr:MULTISPECIES: response regulator [Paenibacillus]AHC19759.1 chemotaxis protein CheY [Paenibacillus polymyxa CR1]ALA42014.1 chemotaxis protein CheY [Paenibacillus peoriae]APB76257.1 DNA-binding response regulator [Paenibacillus polymyxa]MCP3745209.1 response regulator [Paenibacillus sp. A3M_27_13]MDR6779189.1 YesN/AraC family two-component response regulator [Paenibacillus peoriae]
MTTKLLIADDEKNIRMGLQAMIEREFSGLYECVLVKDGMEAWQHVKQFLPELVITDIRMPVMDGIMLMQHIHELEPGRRPLVIILSGYDEFQYAREAIRCGAREYLLKPIVREELFGALAVLNEELKQRNHLIYDGVVSVEKDRPAGASAIVDRSGSMTRAIQYIHAHYSEDLNMAVVSNSVSLNYTYFSQAFKAYTGLSFVQYVKRLRITEAKKLLECQGGKIYEIAANVGFDNAKHFNKVFRELEGMTPQQFRVQNQRGN